MQLLLWENMDINLNQLYPMILSAVVALIIGKMYEKLPLQKVFTLFGKYHYSHNRRYVK